MRIVFGSTTNRTGDETRISNWIISIKNIFFQFKTYTYLLGRDLVLTIFLLFVLLLVFAIFVAFVLEVCFKVVTDESR